MSGTVSYITKFSYYGLGIARFITLATDMFDPDDIEWPNNDFGAQPKIDSRTGRRFLFSCRNFTDALITRQGYYPPFRKLVP